MRETWVVFSKDQDKKVEVYAATDCDFGAMLASDYLEKEYDEDYKHIFTFEKGILIGRKFCAFIHEKHLYIKKMILFGHTSEITIIQTFTHYMRKK